MKLRTKLLLLMGLTAFLVVAGILLAALTYLTSTLQWIHEEATKYATTDMQIRARNNLFRFRDNLTNVSARAATFYTSARVPADEHLVLLEKRFSHTNGMDAIVFGEYDLEKKEIFSNVRGLVQSHDGEKKRENAFPKFYEDVKEYLTLKTPQNVFHVTAENACWLTHIAPDKPGKGRFISIRFCDRYLNGISMQMESGVLIARDKELAYEDCSALSTAIPEDVRTQLPQLIAETKRCDTEKVVWKTFKDESGTPRWLAGAIAVNLNGDNAGECIRLVKVYQYEQVMSSVTRMIREQLPALFFYVSLIMILGLLFLSVPMLYFSKQLTVPIVQASAFANKLASGELNVHHGAEESGIMEIDRLMNSLNRLRDHLNATIGKLRRSHGKEIEARVGAENTNLVKSDFLDALSQEYREPLNALYSFADLLEHRTRNSETIPSDELLAVLKAVNISMDTLSDMGITMQELAELDTPNAANLNRGRIETYQMLHEINNTFTNEAKKQSVTVEIHYSTGIPPVICTDPVKLRRMLASMQRAVCRSAFKGATVTFACGVKDDQFQFTCTGKNKDNPAPLEYTLYNSSQRPLREFEFPDAIIHFTAAGKLAQALGGSFDVNCPDDLGFQVVCSIPLSELTPGGEDEGEFYKALPPTGRTMRSGETKEQLFRNMSSIHALSQKPQRVLLAEDDDSSAILLDVMLRGINCQVTKANTVDQTKDLLQKQSFDVLILDLNMYDLDRFPFLAGVRKELAERCPCIIVLSGVLKSGERNRLISAGADQCLLKPIHLSDLTEAIRASLQKQR